MAFLLVGCGMVSVARKAALYPECSKCQSQGEAYDCMNGIIAKEGKIRGSATDKALMTVF